MLKTTASTILAISVSAAYLGIQLTETAVKRFLCTGLSDVGLQVVGGGVGGSGVVAGVVV